MIARMPLQLSYKLGRTVRKGKIARPGISTAWSQTRHVDEHHRQPSLAESPRELGGAADYLADGVHGRQPDNAFLQVNHDQGGNGIGFCERHVFPFGCVRLWVFAPVFARAVTRFASSQIARLTSC